MPEPTIDIIVPTLGRAEKLRPLVFNIINVTPGWQWTVRFVLDEDDAASHFEVDALADNALGAVVEKVVCDGTYPVKVNAGVRASLAQFVCLSGDDAVWHPGWNTAALKAFKPGVHVVGTRDLTPSSADGTHSTQPIARRSYLVESGGAWDEPGVTYHEGYHHNFCETELCALAQHRGVWAFEPASVIEHRHPDWGTAEEDDTYKKGARVGWQEDAALFALRRSQWSRS